MKKSNITHYLYHKHKKKTRAKPNILQKTGKINNNIETDVKPNGSGNSDSDDTVISGPLPQTGIKLTLIITTAIISIIGVIIYRKYKKYKV